MKTLKLLLVFVIFLMISQNCLSQNKCSQVSKNYLVDFEGNVTKKMVRLTEVHLRFDLDVPELTDEQVSQLLKNGKIQLSEKPVKKGHYEQFILFYVPRVEVDSCFLKDGFVSYKGFETKDQPRMFSWWYLAAVLSIVFMILAQITNNLGLSVVFVAAIMAAFMDAFVAAVVLVAAEEKKTSNICVYLYYVCMVIACIFAYLQW